MTEKTTDLAAVRASREPQKRDEVEKLVERLWAELTVSKRWELFGAGITIDPIIRALRAASASPSDDGARQPQDIMAIRERLLKHTRGEELAWSPEYSKWRMLKDIQAALAEIDRLQAVGERR